MSAESARSSSSSSLAALRSCSSSRSAAFSSNSADGADLAIERALILVGAGAEQLPEPVGQPPGRGFRRLRRGACHTDTVRGGGDSGREHHLCGHSRAHRGGAAPDADGVVSALRTTSPRRSPMSPAPRPSCGNFAADRTAEGVRTVDTASFQPTLDWGNEWFSSTMWVLTAFALSAVALGVVLVLIGRFTEWGRQFWRVTGDYFTGPGQPDGVGAGRAAVAVGDPRRSASTCCSATTPTTCSPRCRSPSPQRRRPRCSAASHGFWATMVIFAVLAVVLRRAHAARHVPDAAVHHAVANLAEPALHRRLARRLRLLPRRSSRAGRSTTPTNASSRTSTSSPPGSAATPNNPIYNSGNTLLFGAVEAVLSVLVVRRDPVAAVRAADARRGHAAAGPVLDRHRLRAGRHDRRVRRSVGR